MFDSKEIGLVAEYNKAHTPGSGRGPRMDSLLSKRSYPYRHLQLTNRFSAHGYRQAQVLEEPVAIEAVSGGRKP